MNQLAVITGASSGIGKSFAYALAKSYDLVLIARRKELLDAIAEDLKKFGNNIEVYVADLADEKELSGLERHLEFKKVSFLVNAAGFSVTENFCNSGSDVVREMTNLHVTATTRLCRIVLPWMTEQKEGTIINIASVSGFLRVDAGNILYDSTKAYLIRFSELLKQDVARNNVRVQVLCPGFTRTNFFENYQIPAKIPGFLWIEPDKLVQKSLKKLSSGKTIYIPGWHYKIISLIIRNSVFLPLLKIINNLTLK